MEYSMKISFLCFLIGAINLSAKAQLNEQIQNVIKEDDLKRYVRVLSSDSLEGRFTASEGQKKAALYIAENMSSIGVSPLFDSYYDTFSLYEYSWGKIYIRTRDKWFNNQEEIAYLGFCDQAEEKKVDLVFAGYGSEGELSQIDVKDRMVLLFSKNIRASFNIQQKIKKMGAYGAIMANPENSKQFNAIKNSRAAHLLAKRFSFSELEMPENNMQKFVIRNHKIKTLTGKSIFQLKRLVRKGTIDKCPLSTIYIKSERKIKKVQTENVAGLIKGKSDKYIVVSAHYDHLGKGKSFFYPGADDNASGVASMLEIADFFSTIENLNHQMIFLATTGEETDFLGAKHFINEHGFDSSNILVNINLDMIARSNQEETDYLYVVGTDVYQDFKPFITRADSAYTPCRIDYRLESEDNQSTTYLCTDQYIFHKKNIPAILFHTGLHDDYHKPTDLPSRINFNLLKKRTVLITLILLEIQKMNGF